MSKKRMAVNLDEKLILWLKEKAKREFTTVAKVVTRLVVAEKEADELVPPPPVKAVDDKKAALFSLSEKSRELLAKHAKADGISKTALLEKLLRGDLAELCCVVVDARFKKAASFTLSQYARDAIDAYRARLGTNVSKTELLERVIQLKLSI